MKLRPIQGLVALLLFGACGGSVSGGGEDAPEPDPRTEEPGQSGTDDSGDDANADAVLGACELGRPAYEDFSRPCAWIADARCYETRDMACNCACPRQGTSQCASGFDGGPNGRVWVSCD